MRLTPWFPASTKPVRVGVYETRTARSYGPDILKGFSYWDGWRWYVATRAPQSACGYNVSLYQSRQWRGILKGSK